MDSLQELKVLIEGVLKEDEIVLYDVGWYQEAGRKILRVAIEHQDETMDIETCTIQSAKISAALDEIDKISYEYYLEVCSPGAERELKTIDQMQRALNEYVYVKLKNPKAGIDEVTGYLKEADENSIKIDYQVKNIKKQMVITNDNIALLRLAVKI